MVEPVTFSNTLQCLRFSAIHLCSECNGCESLSVLFISSPPMCIFLYSSCLIFAFDIIFLITLKISEHFIRQDYNGLHSVQKNTGP
jgi:hypothetical protein